MQNKYPQFKSCEGFQRIGKLTIKRIGAIIVRKISNICTNESSRSRQSSFESITEFPQECPVWYKNPVFTKHMKTSPNVSVSTWNFQFGYTASQHLPHLSGGKWMKKWMKFSRNLTWLVNETQPLASQPLSLLLFFFFALSQICTRRRLSSSYFFCEHKQRIKRLEWKWRLCVIQLRGKEIKTDSVQSSNNYLQKLFTENLLTAR